VPITTYRKHLSLASARDESLVAWDKLRTTLRWLPAYVGQHFMLLRFDVRPVHLIIAVADHFEPSIRPDVPGAFADRHEQERRLEKWCRQYPAAVGPWPDDDGKPFRHTYFYPAEQYDAALIDHLEKHCRAGWGEVEIHLHHGVHVPDNAENTRHAILEFRDALAAHGCLSQLDGNGPPRYAFVHGNWALANSARGRFCGVDDEMKILAETGCYADFTLPSAPSPAQVSKINSLYECGAPLDEPVPHRRGRNLQCGRAPKIFPLMIQGPLMLNLGRQKHRWPFPGIENGELTTANPPTMERLRLWQQAAITVHGRPEWLFIKLHCHGMDPRDEQAMLGSPIQQFLRELVGRPQRQDEYLVHFVTAREMVNIVLAACDGHSGNPGLYRDYRFHLIRACPGSSVSATAEQNMQEANESQIYGRRS
jgi:hypothetical protein